ncbi:hypothetical protein ACFYT4_21860 [Streptomyces sp. NPDC004609]|uniref:hypothetical protein n=1 Tax=Streptomyces sp. NPDC004609 TaxID=3364704 RepID=UPI00368E2C31
MDLHCFLCLFDDDTTPRPLTMIGGHLVCRGHMHSLDNPHLDRLRREQLREANPPVFQPQAGYTPPTRRAPRT